jgi:hypothetical protein
MSFIGAFGHEHPASRTTRTGRLVGYHKNLAEHSRLVLIQNMIQQINRELESLKGRLNRLEGPNVLCMPQQLRVEDAKLGAAAQSPPPLPVDELKELAEMIRRFR